MNFVGLIQSSLRHRGLVVVLALAVLLSGIVVATALPVDVLPDLTRPMVSIQTETPGLAPEDVESQVTLPVERAVSGLQDVSRVRSVSTPGLSVVYAEFAWGSDVFRNRQLVAERIDAIRAQLGPDVAPRLGPMTSLMGEVMLVGLSIAKDGHDAQAVRDYADWTLRPTLMSLPGVAQVLAIGGEVRQVEIRPDLQRLQLNGVTLAQVAAAAAGFGNNSGGGFVDGAGSEIALRGIGRPFRIDDLLQVAVAWRDIDEQGVRTRGAVRLGQVAQVGDTHRQKRGDAGVDGQGAVIVSIQQQPGADPRRLTRAIERALHDADAGLPPGSHRTVLFRQADFIEQSMGNVQAALLHGALIVALVLLVFLRGWRSAAISMAALPLSVVLTLLALKLLGLSINTMTLGGVAIAVGELVDDAVVGVENAVRRLRGNAVAGVPRDPLQVIAQATLEVRGGILYATLLIVLVFVPLFALDGVEGRLFAPLGIAYIVSILASLLVAVTVTPALTALLFGARRPAPGERRWLASLKRHYRRALSAVLERPVPALLGVAVLVIVALVVGSALPRSFLPSFNEPTLTVNLLLAPGVSLAESDHVGLLAESLALQVPDVAHVGRRTGRAEGDEHAEGLHYSELELALKPGARPRSVVVADLRAHLAVLPGRLSFGQPISHRLDHVLSGVDAPLAVKIVGDDEATLRRLAAQVAEQLQTISGLTDVTIEAQADVPQLRIRVDPRRAALYGVSPPRVQDALSTLSAGRTLSPIIEGEKRYDLVLRLAEAQRDAGHIGDALFDTPAGPVPLGWLATIDSDTGPNQILRENLRRRIVVSAQAGPGFSEAAAQAARRLAHLPLPAGYALHIEGQAAEQRQAMQRIAALAALSLLLMAAVLHARYRSLRLTLIVLGTVPLAMTGGLAALAITHTPLSVASLVGLVTLAGIAARNGILKISHYLNLALAGEHPFGPELVLQGSSERLTPVLMTAVIAGLALAPLLMAAEAPGKEILHPVALVIFGGLISATLLDAFVTPVLFLRYGHAALQRLPRQMNADTLY